MSILVFLIVYIYIANWVQFRDLATRLLQPKQHFSPFRDETLIQRLRDVTGLNFEIKVVDSPRVFGFMPGIPIKPILLVSQGALDRLSSDGLEWLTLHEAGHCLHWHSAIESVMFVAIGSVGMALIGTSHLGWWWAILLSIVLSVMWFQLTRLLELQVDEYALEHMANPQGMIEANEIMEKLVGSPIYKDKILHRLFTPHLTYQQRIDMARAKLDQLAHQS